MARIRGVTDHEASLWLRAAFRYTRDAVRKLTGRAEVPEPVRIVAHHPLIFLAYGGFETALARSKRMPFRPKELARLRTSTVAGCPW